MLDLLNHSVIHSGGVSLSDTRTLQQSGHLLTLQFDLWSSDWRTHSLTTGSMSYTVAKTPQCG